MPSGARIMLVLQPFLLLLRPAVAPQLDWKVVVGLQVAAEEQGLLLPPNLILLHTTLLCSSSSS